MGPRDVLAAGCVVFRPGRQVLLVHRPKYDDWSFPKGKLDPGEHPTAAAVREVEEETGVRVRLGVPLTRQRYEVATGMKTVFYWVARAVDCDRVADYEPNDEIDEVAWLSHDAARKRLTHEHDRETLAEAWAARRRTHAVLVVRHAQARLRKNWSRNDRRRPLLAEGRAQAGELVPVLAAYAPTRVVTSSSTRCLQTVAPFVAAHGLRAEEQDGLSQEDATASSVRTIVRGLLRGDADAVLCTHRPVLPLVLDALGVAEQALAPGEVLVAHVRRGAVVATETHLPR